MKICTNCGQQMEDQSTFCTNCGAAFAAPVEQAPVQQVPVQDPYAQQYTQPVPEQYAQPAAAPVTEPAAAPAKKDNKKMIIIIAAIAAAFALLLGLIGIIAGANAYKKPLDDFTKILTGKANKATVKRMFPKDVWEYYDEEYDMSFDDMYEEYEENKEDLQEELEDAYGKNVKVKYKVTKKKAVKKSDLSDMKDELHELGIKESSVKKAYKLDIDMTISGRDDDEEEEMELHVVKIGSKWYIYEVVVGAMGFGF